MNTWPARWALVIQVGALACLGFLLVAAYVARRCYRAEASAFTGQRHTVDPAPSRAELPEAQVVTFSAGTLTIRGLYAASRNRAAIVLLHGSSSDRNGMLAEARTLHDAGFGVLLYDSPGHGESDGDVHWSQNERRALHAAFDFAAAQPEVDAEQIGVLGFSMGSYIAAIGAAEDARWRAVALVCGPSTVREHTRHEYRRYGPLGQFMALRAIEHFGMDLDGPNPLSEVPRIAPRALLIVGGRVDPVVPAFMVQDVFDVAREPKQLQWIENGAHGGFAATPESSYGRALLQFFARALT